MVVGLLVTGVPLAAGLGGSAASAASTPRLIFGMGDEVSGAEATPLYGAAPINMVTSWYNGPGDLGWMTGYRNTSQMSQIYASGRAQELVVWLANDPSYAISAQFQSDIASLVTTFAGNGPQHGPLYVVLFSEFETYSSDPSYQAQLLDAYVSAVKVIHAAYSQAKVALGFGGYDWTTADPVRDLSAYTAAIAASDFLAVQEMQSCSDEPALESQVKESVAQLGALGKPVMISHFKLWGGTTACETSAMATFESHMWTKSELSTLTSEGLFAWGLMDDGYVNSPGSSYTTAVSDITAYGSGADIGLPPWSTPSTTTTTAAPSPTTSTTSTPTSTSATSPNSSSTTTTTTTTEPGGGTTSGPRGGTVGYWLTGADGGVFAFGGAGFHGSTGAIRLDQPIVSMASTPDGGGYWFVARDGGVFAFGDARFAGAVPSVAAVSDVVGIAACPSGGYWVAGADGTVWSFGGAPSFPSLGSYGVHVDNMVGIAASAGGRGFYLVASDGGVYAYGDATFHGSMGGVPLNRPVVGLAVDPVTGGYWEVAADGGVFAFDAPYFGSTGNLHLARPIVGISATPDSGGYWFVASDGGVFSEGDARYSGSLPGIGVVSGAGIVGMSTG
jgi:hypothetical protein